MLLPDKHVKIAESILGLAALVVANLQKPLPFDDLMAVLTPKFETPEWPAYHNTETVLLALCFLYSAALVEVTPEGDLYRCG
jgi:hypothetical protein